MPLNHKHNSSLGLIIIVENIGFMMFFLWHKELDKMQYYFSIGSFSHIAYYCRAKTYAGGSEKKQQLQQCKCGGAYDNPLMLFCEH